MNNVLQCMSIDILFGLSSSRTGVPLSTPAVWKEIFRDNVNLKRNWAKGRCKVTDMAGHTKK